MIELLTIFATAALNVGVTLAVMRAELRHLRRDTTRAHRRLDMIGAPNVTLDDA